MSEHCANFFAFHERFLTAAPRGSHARHYQLGPYWYPPDEPKIRQFIEDELPFEEFVGERYRGALTDNLGRGVTIERLLIAPDPPDPDFHRINYAIMRPLI